MNLNTSRKRADDTLASRFECHVIAHQDRPAVETDSGVVTYGELGAMADSVAAHLEALASRRDEPVCLLMEEGPRLIAAMFGAIKVGRLFIVLDVNFSEGWLSQVITISGTKHILTDNSSRPVAERIAGTELQIFDVEQLIRNRTRPHALPTLSTDDPALIGYTSGSTGRPKGVVLSHRTLLHTPDVRAELLQLRPSDRIANLRSSGVVAGIHNTLLPLLNGACLLPFDIRRLGLHRLTPWLMAQEITGITFSSSLLRTWLSSLPADLRFSSLRFVVASAEPLYGVDVDELVRRLQGDWRIMHTLVSTETGIIAAQMFDPSIRPEPGIVPVGRIVPDTEILLEKDDGTPAGPGESGEIVVKSPFLSHGYWNDPDATAQAFRDGGSGTRLYRSGDLGRFRSDGSLEHLGHKSRKIKLRGFSVEPYEIECALVALPDVRDAIVTVKKNGPDDLRLIAHVVWNGDCTPDAGRAIRTSLAKSLPAHMVPAHVIALKSFPLTPRGKVDRAALPMPSGPEMDLSAYRAPSDDHERALAAIWQETLKLPKVGIDDDFYDLGGTSLQAFVIFARIAARLSRDLPPTTMMQAPTVAKQAAILRGSANVTASTVIPFRTAGAREPLFVVHARFGDIMFLKEIARDLKSDRPIYGIQPPPLDGAHRIPKTIEAIAAGYLADMRKVQPMGPYYLAGFSWGGRLALEMAQQLVRQGQQVAFLGLIDTIYDIRYEVLSERPASRLMRHLGAIRRESIGSYVKTRLERTAIHSLRNGRDTLRHFPNKIRLSLSRPIPYTQRADFYDHLYGRARDRYSVRPYSGAIALFSSQGNSEAQRACWSAIALGGLTVREIPASHLEMIWPPYSVMLAACFDECLQAGER